MTKPHFEVVISAPAALDITNITDWSETEFGEAAAQRYEELIAQALIDIGEDPKRLGARNRHELISVSTYTYHIALSRNHIKGKKVKTPRHFILYRLTPPTVEVIRILHDSCDLMRHVPDDHRSPEDGID